MDKAIPNVKVVEDVTVEKFRDEIIPANEPVLFKGMLNHWPAVQAARESPEAMIEYVHGFDSGTPVETIIGRPEIDGKFFYNEKMDGLNFSTMPDTISASAKRILSFKDEENPPTTYVQSASIPKYLPGFEAENTIGLIDSSVVPRIWIGNRITVQTHFDLKENIACLVAGRRRFTLFPPSQTPNLYPGPFELTLSGPPVSMVKLDEPDFDRYPRFKQALEHVIIADLEPGDALYIPYFWWHHVCALDDLNVLVNFWWDDADPDIGSPYDALLYGVLKIRDMPEHQRNAWRAMFDNYVFGRNGDPLEHLPPQLRGLLGEHNLPVRQKIRKILLEAMVEESKIAIQRHQQSTSEGNDES